MQRVRDVWSDHSCSLRCSIVYLLGIIKFDAPEHRDGCTGIIPRHHAHDEQPQCVTNKVFELVHNQVAVGCSAIVARLVGAVASVVCFAINTAHTCTTNYNISVWTL